MKIRDIPPMIDVLNRMFRHTDPISIQYSDPWHLKYSNPDPGSLEMTGIFVMSVCKERRWEDRLTESDRPVFFIGRTRQNFQKDILRLFRCGTQDKFPVLGSPPYMNNHWGRNSYSIDRDILDNIIRGNMLIYLITMDDPLYNAPVLQAFLLNCYLSSIRSLPPLNHPDILLNI